MPPQTTNPEYDNVIQVAQTTAYEGLKEEIENDNPTRVLQELRAIIANTWNQEKDIRVPLRLEDMGYAAGSAIQNYYTTNWSQAAGRENPLQTQARGGSGFLAGIAAQTPNLRLTPGAQKIFGEPNSTGGSAGAPNITPEDMGPNAYIQIDTASFGGQRWGGMQQLKFQFFGDSSFADIGTANYATHDTIGRSESYLAYERTSTREFTISLRFVAQGNKGDSSAAIEQEVKEKVDWCRALTYPLHEGGIMYPPPVVLVGLGQMYVRGGTPLRCVTQSAAVTYCPDDSPMEPETFLPYVANVELSFACVYMTASSEDILDANTILEGKF